MLADRDDFLNEVQARLTGTRIRTKVL
jgi:hypothetical protein